MYEGLAQQTERMKSHHTEVPVHHAGVQEGGLLEQLKELYVVVAVEGGVHFAGELYLIGIANRLAESRNVAQHIVIAQVQENVVTAKFRFVRTDDALQNEIIIETLERLNAFEEILVVDTREELRIFAEKSMTGVDMKASTTLHELYARDAFQVLLGDVFADCARSIPEKIVPAGLVAVRVWIIDQIDNVAGQIEHGAFEHRRRSQFVGQRFLLIGAGSHVLLHHLVLVRLAIGLLEYRDDQFVVAPEVPLQLRTHVRTIAGHYFGRLNVGLLLSL